MNKGGQTHTLQLGVDNEYISSEGLINKLANTYTNDPILTQYCINFIQYNKHDDDDETVITNNCAYGKFD